MTRERWKAVLVLLATFLVGAVAGAGALRGFSEHRFGRELHRPWPEARERFVLEAMTRRLDLTDVQRRKVERILASHRGERRRALAKCRPEHEALRAKVDAEIRSVLTPEQQRIQGRILERREHRRRGR